MPQNQGARGRVSSGDAKAAVAADFVIGAGWGGTATLALATGSTDQCGRFTITASATTPAQATATIVHTFAGGAFDFAPIALVTTTNTNSIDTGHVTCTTTTTAATYTFAVTPVAAAVYTFNYLYVEKPA